MVTITDSRTEQRLAALAHGNQARMANAQLRRDLKAMRKRDAYEEVAALLESPVWPADALPVMRLLVSVPGVGPERASRWLVRAGVVSGSRRVRELTVRQRTVLARVLCEEAERFA